MSSVLYQGLHRLRHKLVGVALAASLLVSTPASLASELVNFSPELLERVKGKWGANAVIRLSAMKDLVAKNGGLTEEEKLKVVNDFFNSIPYYRDIDHWGKDDYWATPFEKLTTFGGDCEDYAIAKYFTLRELGIDDGKMRISYVKALDWNEAHMVLTYSPSPRKIPVVLDNLRPDILPANERKDLVPVYSFNVQGLWLAKERGTGQFVGSADRLGEWADMLKRLSR